MFPTTDEFDHQPATRRTSEFLSPHTLRSIRGVLLAPCNIVLEPPEAPALETPLTPTFGWEDLPDYRGWIPGTPPAPLRTSLLGSGTVGKRLQLTGRVLTRNGTPLPGVKLEFWQADATGRYDNGGTRLKGIQHSDADGRFVLETIVPGYSGRVRRISYIATANWAGWSPQEGEILPPDNARLPGRKEALQLAAGVHFATDPELRAPVQVADRPYVRPGAATYADDPSYLALSAMSVENGAERASYDIVFDVA